MTKESNLNNNDPKGEVGSKKLPLALVPGPAIAHMAMAMADGVKKYGPYNWRHTKVAAMTYIHAAKRHIDAWIDGDDVAIDSGAHHLAHAAACMAIVLDALEAGTLVDDRPPATHASQVLQESYFNRVPPEASQRDVKRTHAFLRQYGRPGELVLVDPAELERR